MIARTASTRSSTWVGPRGEVPARAGGDPAAERRELEGLRVEAQRQPVLGPAAPRARGPLAPAPMRAARETGSTSSTRSSAPRSSATAPSKRARDARLDAADHAGAAAVGDDRDARRPPPTPARASTSRLVARARDEVGGVLVAPAQRAHHVEVGLAQACAARASASPAEKIAGAPAARPRAARAARRPRAATGCSSSSASKPSAGAKARRRRARLLVGDRPLVREAPAPAVALRAIARRSYGAAARTLNATAMADAPGLLARGPWSADDVERRAGATSTTRPPPEHVRGADAAIAALRDRGSPSHDGLPPGCVGHRVGDGRLELELQPMRWALRLVEGDASESVAALCITRDADGRWLAGRRAQWLSSWAGRWALGAGGAVDVGESPVAHARRELREEWSVEPERLRGEALVRLPHKLVMFVGQAWLRRGRRSPPTTSTTRTPGGRRTSSAGRRRPTSRCGGWRRLLA